MQAYDAEEANELTIAEGDELFVYRKNDESGWWLGEIVSGPNKGKKGVSPSGGAKRSSTTRAAAQAGIRLTLAPCSD